MNIICLKVGEMGTNCYLVVDEQTKEAIVIDPGEEGDFISTTLLENKLIPKSIILTHGHFDHCLAALDLKLNFNIPVYLHQEDLFLYEKAHLSAQHFSGITSPKLPSIDQFIQDKDPIPLAGSSLKVIHTPGHTPGSVCLYSPGILLTGDTLFANGVGRTDLSYSSKFDLQKSLALLSKLPKDTRIYPGHEDFGLTLTYNQITIPYTFKNDKESE